MRIADFVMLLMREKHESYNNPVKYRKNLPYLLYFILLYNSYFLSANYSSFTCHI